jgi:hypothetical protein
MYLKSIIINLNIFLLFCASTHAQTEPFKIPLPYNKKPNSLYNSIRLLDIRSDTADFGFVQKGALNRSVSIVAQPSLQTQLNDVMKALIDESAQGGELLLVLRQSRFAEKSKSTSERGYFHFRSILFTDENGMYKKVASVDTVVMVKGFDVTKKMLNTGGETIADFIAANLRKKATDDLTLSADQLRSIDDMEKSNLPLYINSTLTDGIYYNFKSFVNQQPDETGVSATFDKKGRVQRISYTDKKGKSIDIENRFIYAFVYEGKPYISGEFTCYPLEKRDNDFYFTGKVPDAKGEEVFMASAFFGVIGGLIASSATSVFEMKIDHLTGGFIRIKEAEK